MTNNCQHPELCLLSETCVPCAICPNAKEKADDRLALTPCSPSSDTPETDGEWNRPTCQDHPEFEQNLADFARKLEREREKIRAQLREEQRLHVQTLNERDEANAKLDLARVRTDEAIQQTKDLIEFYRKQKP